MENRNSDSHPDIERLAEYGAGHLDTVEAGEIKQHLEVCPLCRLEIKKMDRFSKIDTDIQLEESSDWSRAGAEMERFFSERIIKRPEAGKDNKTRINWKRWHLYWLMPAAVAATLVVIFAIKGPAPGRMESDHSYGPLRGDTVEKVNIELLVPAGRINRVPLVFNWKSDQEYEFYSLEIFKADLTEVYSCDSIKGTTLILPDSSASIFKKGETYLWNVKAYKSVERVSSSNDSWFKILEKDNSKDQSDQ